MYKVGVFGLPASGKGTLASFLEQEYGWTSLSTGAMIRRISQMDTPLGEEFRKIPVGTFANDDLIIKAVQEELTLDMYKEAVILDGFPRTLNQWEAMKKQGLSFDAVIFINVPEEVLIDRAVNRRVHTPSGRVYNLKSNPPVKEGLDDVTQEPLTRRSDDYEEVIIKRFKDYWDKTHPVVEVIKKNQPEIFLEVNGLDKPEDIQKEVASFLKKPFEKKIKP